MKSNANPATSATIESLRGSTAVSQLRAGVTAVAVSGFIQLSR